MTKKYTNNPRLLNSSLSRTFWGALLFCLFGLGLNAQVATRYQFATATSTYSPLTGGIILGDDSNDDDDFNNIAIGFPFTFNCTVFSNFSVNSNGYIMLGNQFGSDYYAISDNGSTNNVIAALAEDIQSTSGTGQLSHSTAGTSPNRVLTVDWKSYKKYGSNGVGDNYNFQIKLYETTNNIEIIYGTFTNNANPGVFEVGIRGASNTDYSNRTTTSDWAATSAGTSNTATCSTTASIVPVSGTTLRWNASPNNPLALTQDPAVPNCATGSDIIVSGTPGANETWYWQTSATGTSTANMQTGGTHTVYSNGFYHLRAYNSVTMLWSCGASTLEITNFPTATAPATPSADFNPSCASTGGTILTAAIPPSGTSYNWQETNATGTSDALPADVTYTANVSGTYYLAAFDSLTSCWSAATGLAVVVSTFVPEAPMTAEPNIYRCIGDPSAEVNANGNGNGTVETVLGTNISLGAFENAVYNGTFGLPNGATITSTLVSFRHVTTTGGTWASDVACELTGSATVGYTSISNVNTEVTNAGPYNRTATSSGTAGPVSLTLENGWLGTATIDSAILIVNYSLPATTVNWYDAATSGTQLGSGSPFETVGTSILPSTSTAGTFPIYAESVSGGCTSTSRITINVNIAPVSVEITPTAVTCNNGNNGTFAVTDFDCGTGPFSFSVNGGPFDLAPDTLQVGTYTVIVMDANMDESAPYIVVIEDALAPSGLVVNTYNNEMVDLSWNANGAEMEWNIEWGLPGFTLGSGVGSATSSDTTFAVTGLDGSTEYEFYVSANCGLGTTPGDWISTTQTTACDPIIAQGWCESFDSDSPTQDCWTVLNSNSDFSAWDMDDTDQPSTGDESASINTDGNIDFWGTGNDDWLITPPITLTGNEILTFSYSVIDGSEPNDFEVLLSTTGLNPSNFTDTLMNLDSYSNEDYQDTSINLSAFSGNVFIAFHIPDNGLDGWVLYIDDVCVDICTPNLGTSGSVEVCRLTNTLDLNTVITQGETNGVWNFLPNQSAVSGSNLDLTAIPDGEFTAEYIVTTACTADTAVATFIIYPGSSAGIDGVLNVCRNQQINLLSGLTGSIDLGGVWYNPQNVAMASGSINAGTLPGQFNYKYITSNGICPNDTSAIVLNVSATCDALGLEEFVFEGISIFPNPSNGVFTIANTTSDQYFTYEISDLNGRLVKTAKEVNGVATTEVDLSKIENGIYMVRIFNAEGEKMERIVKQ